jgi:6-phosphogluconolactonase
MLIQNRRCARDTLIVVIGTLLVASCGGSNAPQRYTVGGSVSGVVGSGLVLQDNGGNDLAIEANGSFLFSAALANASAYTVTIKTEPTNPSQTCVLSGGNGTIMGAKVSNVVATCTIHPGRFAYVSGHTAIYCYAVDAATGALTALAGSPCASGSLTGVAVDPSGRFAYATQGGSNDIIAYAINSATGDLTAIVGSLLNGGGADPVDVTVDPSGQFVYMANYGGAISAFTIDSVTGALTAVSGSPFATAPPIVADLVPGVNSITIDPTGKFLYAAINAGNDISAYVIDSSTGALTPVAGSPFPAGSVPMTVRVDPSGRYAYVTNMDSDSISAYLINSSTGALTPIPGSPFLNSVGGAWPTGLAIDPSGQFVYVLNQLLNSISAFSINTSTGALTPISGAPFASGVDPYEASVDPSGKFLYVSNNGAGTISVYAIDGTTGSLTPISGSPFAASGSGSSGTYTIAISN